MLLEASVSIRVPRQLRCNLHVQGLMGSTQFSVCIVIPVERAAASADVRASLTSLWSSSCMRKYIDLPVCSDCGGGREGGREGRKGRKIIHSQVRNIKSKKSRRGGQYIITLPCRSSYCVTYPRNMTRRGMVLLAARHYCEQGLRNKLHFDYHTTLCNTKR